MSLQISYNGAYVTTILWTDHGFVPNPDIISVCRKLYEYLDNEDIIGKLCDRLKISETNADKMRYSFVPTLGIQHITLGEMKDVPLNSPPINSLIGRIYICDDTKNMKSKITVTSIIRHNPSWTTVEMSDILRKIYTKNEDICKFIYEKIPSDYGLGKINYLSSISGIESPFNSLNDILDSRYNSNTKKIEFGKMSSISDPQSIADVYSVLLTRPSSIASATIDKDSVIAEIEKYKVKESKIKVPIHQRPLQIVPAKTFNFRLLPSDMSDGVPRRIISNLTEPNCGHTIMSNLTSDYLGST